MRFDYCKLEKKIALCFENFASFAEEVDISSKRLKKLLNGKEQFSAAEMERVFNALEIKPEEIGDYFFNLVV